MQALGALPGPDAADLLSHLPNVHQSDLKLHVPAGVSHTGYVLF